MPIRTWRYKEEDAGVRHMGPTAQDFRAAFGLGDTDKAIAGIDAENVVQEERQWRVAPHVLLQRAGVCLEGFDGRHPVEADETGAFDRRHAERLARGRPSVTDADPGRLSRQHLESDHGVGVCLRPEKDMGA